MRSCQSDAYVEQIVLQDHQQGVSRRSLFKMFDVLCGRTKGSELDGIVDFQDVSSSSIINTNWNRAKSLCYYWRTKCTSDQATVWGLNGHECNCDTTPFTPNTGESKNGLNVLCSKGKCPKKYILQLLKTPIRHSYILPRWRKCRLSNLLATAVLIHLPSPTFRWPWTRVSLACRQSGVVSSETNDFCSFHKGPGSLIMQLEHHYRMDRLASQKHLAAENNITIHHQLTSIRYAGSYGTESNGQSNMEEALVVEKVR